MQSIVRLVDQLVRRALGWRESAPPQADRPHERPLTFSEILAASTAVEFGGVPLDIWPRLQQLDEDAQQRGNFTD